MKNAKEYIQKQIFVAGSRVPISAIQYYDEDNFSFCPFCGAAQEQRMIDGKLVMSCSERCEGFENEQVLLETERRIQEEVNEATERLNAIREKINNNAMTAGTKTAARHYMDLAPERLAFDREIELLTK